MHHRPGISDDDRVLDLACGSGLALELAILRVVRPWPASMPPSG